MKEIVVDKFIKNSSEALLKILESLNKLEYINLEQLLSKKETALIIVDMNNGFCNKGALYSKRIEDLKEEVTRIAYEFNKYPSIPILTVSDNHPYDSIEFKSYLPHCISGTEEAEIIQELSGLSNNILLKKNSTNAFASDEFKNKIIELNQIGINNFIVVGDCTDICIYQACINIKTHFININKEVNVIVPMNAVDTFDLDITNHNGDLMNVMFLYSLISNGVEVVKGLR